MNTESTIQRYIADEMLLEDGDTQLGPDTKLLTSGLLDSMALLRLVAFVEKEFNVTVEDGELVPDHFETIGLMKEFLARKTQHHDSTSGRPE